MRHAIVAALVAGAVARAGAQQQADVIIRGGMVHDGTGGPGRVADVVLRGDRLELCQRAEFEPSCRVGGAIERCIVHHDNVSIFRETKIELDGVGPCSNGLSKRFERVLGCVCTVAAVRNDRTCQGVEQDH